MLFGSAQATVKDSNFREAMSGALYGGDLSVQPPLDPVFEVNFITPARVLALKNEKKVDVSNINVFQGTVKVIVTPKALKDPLSPINAGFANPAAYKVFRLKNLTLSEAVDKKTNVDCKAIAVAVKNFDRSGYDKLSPFLSYDYKDAFSGLVYLEYDFPQSCFNTESNLSLSIRTEMMELRGRSFYRVASEKLGSKLKKAVLGI